jgi:aminopeptidase N
VTVVLKDDSDQSHPIVNTIKDAGEESSMFDSIPYKKGAAFIGEIEKMFGMDTLKTALRQYFAKYSWDNTELKDFIGVLSEAYEKSNSTKLMGDDFKLKPWAEKWLTTTGISTIEPLVTYDETGGISFMSIKQSSEGKQGNPSKLHKMMVDLAVYDENMNRDLIENVVIDQQEITELSSKTYRGFEKVKFIVPNSGNHAYVKVRLDERSQKNLLEIPITSITN